MIEFLLMLAVAQDVGPGVPQRAILRDRGDGPTPVTDKFLIPQKAPDCRTEAEVQKALAQLRQGDPGDCFIRDKQALRAR